MLFPENVAHNVDRGATVISEALFNPSIIRHTDFRLKKKKPSGNIVNNMCKALDYFSSFFLKRSEQKRDLEVKLSCFSGLSGPRVKTEHLTDAAKLKCAFEKQTAFSFFGTNT